MRKLVLTLMLVVGVILLTAPAQADWFPGDDYKMHYPQLPDPNGWDVDVLTDTVYDDFLCTGDGPINDFHFWVSWKGGLEGQITWVDVSLHKDVPANDPSNILGYSYPDSVMYSDPNTLWQQRFEPGQFGYIPYGTGQQGWISPEEPTVIPNDHDEFFQINIDNIDAPFIQEQGTIYWVGLHIGVADPATSIGWKTTQDHWNDDAVYYYTIIGHPGPHWNELFDPITGESLDMAFVITPEPATLALLALGGIALIRRR